MALTDAAVRSNPCQTTPGGKELIEELLRARKQMRIYPENNPVHREAARKLFQRFNDYFRERGEFTWKIDRYSITCNEETIYHKEDRDDNLALFFFRDGLRTLSFRQGLTEEELREFVRILNIDFDAEAEDDDIVTLMWEADFQHIKYLVDENFLSDWEITGSSAISDEAIRNAHAAGLMSEESKPWRPAGVDEETIERIKASIEEHKKPRTRKTATILVEMFRRGKDTGKVARFLEETVRYAVSKGDFGSAAYILEQTVSFRDSGTTGQALMSPLISAINGPRMIGAIGELLSAGCAIDEEDFLRFARFFDERAIPHLMRIMGDEENLRSRRILIGALSVTGRLNIHAIGRFITDDRWYVVRNTAMILGNIGSAEAISYLERAVGHEDSRVRKTVTKSLGSSGSSNILHHIVNALRDSNVHVRIAAARALSDTGMDEAKKALMQEMSGKQFHAREINEKKEFFSALARWRDPDVKEFCLKALGRRRLFKKARHEETRACAAYALGMLELKESIPALQKAMKSSNSQLKKMSSEAIRRLSMQ
jgi:hypothetical protein